MGCEDPSTDATLDTARRGRTILSPSARKMQVGGDQAWILSLGVGHLIRSSDAFVQLTNLTSGRTHPCMGCSTHCLRRLSSGELPSIGELEDKRDSEQGECVHPATARRQGRRTEPARRAREAAQGLYHIRGGVSTNYATSTMHPSDLCVEKPEMHLRCQMGLILRLSAKVAPRFFAQVPRGVDHCVAHARCTDLRPRFCGTYFE